MQFARLTPEFVDPPTDNLSLLVCLEFLASYGSIVARRGPKRKRSWNVSTFLLRRANADFLPRKEEADYLCQNGFGECQDESLNKCPQFKNTSGRRSAFSKYLEDY